ncbi:Glycine-rich domain-containing protein 2 [Bienertia sinuspersici]
MKVQHYWLHLIAKHLENPISDESLVVPLDCEWIWHCHRLNPIRYKTDCEKLYGRVLDNYNILSSTQGTSMRETKKIWNIMYPIEPYELDHNRKFPIVLQKMSAVVRQDSFYYQNQRDKIDIGFSGATNQWKETFSLSYLKEGALYRGTIPTPVLLEFMEIKNLPDTHKGNLCGAFSKKQLDMLFNTRRTLIISSEFTDKQVARFQCEPTRDFHFEVMCDFPSNIPFGTCSLSFRECMSFGSQLFVNK